MEVAGILSYLAGFVIFAGIYSVFALGLNVHWGFTGLFNIGVAGFFALGAYTTALLTTQPPDPALFEDFKFGGNMAEIWLLDLGFDLWFFLGLGAAAAVCGVVALVIGYITLRLRDDYLAIATLGIAETVRLFFLNEKWVANGSKGLYRIPAFLGDLVAPEHYGYLYLVVVLVVLLAVFLLVQRAVKSPWGRVLRAIREDETAAQAVRQGRVPVQASGLHPWGGDHGHRRRPVRPSLPVPGPPHLRPLARHLRHLGHADGRRFGQQPGSHPWRFRGLGNLVRHPVSTRNIRRPQSPPLHDRRPHSRRNPPPPQRHPRRGTSHHPRPRPMKTAAWHCP